MKTLTKPETTLRQWVSQAMSGHWLMTWHENHATGPGTPDLDYVMNGDGYETGWLELKAEAYSKSQEYTFGLRAQQHTWMEAHCERVPCHFLVAAGDLAFLIHGRLHSLLDDRPMSVVELERLSLAKVSMNILHRQEAAFTLRRALRAATQRGRDA